VPKLRTTTRSAGAVITSHAIPIVFIRAAPET
jgi:hypothetical protein